MRIVVVSAHYPPNFVSGGTLVPQRLARALSERGHEVSVFAGRLERDGVALAETDEVADDGLRVHWIDTTPFTAWTDPLNYDNPRVAEAFARYLEVDRPDAVHFHAMQTFGGSLVSVAADMGCRTVVTMHDFWWICARQFLVDQDMHPCSLVVDAGACECEEGRASLEARTRVLAPHLARADLVLAPSSITASVLAANGVAPGRLRVDENGMLDTSESVTAVTSGPERVSTDPVRFRFHGGAHPLKGSQVLADAIGLLDDSTNWELTIHAGDQAGPFDAVRDNPRVTLAPAFDPAELTGVLAATDVLVMPSLRETHSIATREALLAGVPVLTTASLGPEEVVHDGVNGLVVPADDPESLAAAMRRLVDDRDLLAQLTARASDVRVRSFREQVDNVEAALDPSLADPAPGPGEAWVPRRVVFVVGIDGAPLRYRAQFPAEALGLLGIETEVFYYTDPRLPEALATAEAAVFYRVPATPWLIDLIDRAHRRRVPVVFDADDLIVDPTIADQVSALRALPAEEAKLWLEGVRRYRTSLEHAGNYVGSTGPLVDHVAEVTGLPAHHYPNGFGLELGRLSDQARSESRTPGPVRIGYLSGTRTHAEDFAFVEPALVEVLEARPDVELWLAGHLPNSPALRRFGDRLRVMPFRPWTELPALLRDLDVNLAPLGDHGPFNEAKSAIKWLEAALVETVTVASPTRPFIEAIQDGHTGLLAETPEEWRDQILALVDDRPLRRRLGSAARRRAMLEWSPHLQGPRYLEILRSVRNADDVHTKTDWVDVVRDDAIAPSPIPLDPYPSEESEAERAADRTADRTPAREPSLFEKLRWSLTNESPLRIGRRFVKRITRRP